MGVTKGMPYVFIHDTDGGWTGSARCARLGCAANQIQHEDIIAAFFHKFESFYDMFIGQGFQALEELYYKTWLHSGQRVIVQQKNENEDQLFESVVTIQGLIPSGYLLAAGEDGQIFELHPDGNGFDFFKGLVRGTGLTKSFNCK